MSINQFSFRKSSSLLFPKLNSYMEVEMMNETTYSKLVALLMTYLHKISWKQVTVAFYSKFI